MKEMLKQMSERIATRTAEPQIPLASLPWGQILVSTLRMSPFGKMQMEMIIPEGVRFSVFNKYKKEGVDLPPYESFFQECIDICKEMNIDLRSNWTRFYDACDQKGIRAKKTSPTEPKRPETYQSRVLPPDSENDFWIVEKDVYCQPKKWNTLGYIKNPWAAFMLTLSEYEYPELYLLYLKAHPDNNRLPKELEEYHKLLASTFNLVVI